MRKFITTLLSGATLLSHAAYANDWAQANSLRLQSGMTVHTATTLINGHYALDKVALCGTRRGLVPWQCRIIVYADGDEQLVLAFAPSSVGDGVWRLNNWAVIPAGGSTPGYGT